MKKFKSTWLVAVLALGLGLYIYFIEIKKADKDAEEKTAAEKVLQFAPENVKSIELKSSKGTFTLERDASNHWALTSPVKDAGDDTSINNMLKSLGDEKFDDTLDATDLKPYGLDASPLYIVLKLKDGSTKKLLVGGDAAIPQKIYVQREGEKKVLFAGSAIKNDIDHDLKDLRDKRIFRKGRAEINRIEIKNKNGQLELTQKDHKWYIGHTFANSDVADPDTVNALLGSIESMRATDFPSEKGDQPQERKKYELNTPVTELKLFDDKDKELANVVFGPKKDNNIYISVDGGPTIYQSYMGIADAYNKTADDFKNKKTAFEFDKSSVAEVVMKSSLTSLDLVKTNGKWALAKPDPDYSVSQMEVENLVSKIAAFRVAEFPAEAPADIDDPRGSVTLKDSKGKEIFSMKWGEKTKSAKSYLVKTSKSDGVVGIATVSIDSMPGQTLVEKVEKKESKPDTKTDSKSETKTDLKTDSKSPSSDFKLPTLGQPSTEKTNK